MKKIFSKISLLFIVLFIFTLVGCKPKGDPQGVLNTYYQNIKDNNIEKAYDTFCEETKKEFKKEDFVKFRNAEKEVFKLKETKIEKVKELEGSINDKEFKNIVEFKVHEKGYDFYENKEKKHDYSMYVVNDNGEWRTYFNKELGDKLTSLDLSKLGRMYMFGEGNKTKNLDKAEKVLLDAIILNPANKDADMLLKRLPQIKALN